MNASGSLFNLAIACVSEDEARGLLLGYFSGTKCAHIITANPEILARAARDTAYYDIVKRADLRTADGAGVIFALKFRGYGARLSQRMTGVRLTHILLELAREKSLPVLIALPRKTLTPKDVIRESLSRRYPGLKCTIRSENELPVVPNEVQPVIIFAAHGAPYQDEWIAAHVPDFPQARVAVGVGGTFDFISGKMKRAPYFVQKLGLEWAWRLVLEPRRMKRIWNAVIVFPFIVIRKG